jgi:hypothetical protein
LDEQKRWESVPNRREPFTLEMHKYIAKSAAAKADDCCLDAALANWTICNLYAGCRGIEWLQTDSTRQNLQSYHLNRFGNAYAFTIQDVQCTTESSQILSLQEALQTPTKVGSIRLRFEEQKNGENGETSFLCAITRTQQSALSPTLCKSSCATPNSQSRIQNSLLVFIAQTKDAHAISHQLTSSIVFETQPPSYSTLTR